MSERGEIGGGLIIIKSSKPAKEPECTECHLGNHKADECWFKKPELAPYPWRANQVRHVEKRMAALKRIQNMTHRQGLHVPLFPLTMRESRNVIQCHRRATIRAAEINNRLARQRTIAQRVAEIAETLAHRTRVHPIRMA